MTSGAGASRVEDLASGRDGSYTLPVEDLEGELIFFGAIPGHGWSLRTTGTGLHSYQPDFHTGRKLSLLSGDNEYFAGFSGGKQSHVYRGKLTSRKPIYYYVRLENDGTGSDQIRMSTTPRKPPKRWSLKFYEIAGGKRNVTGLLKAGRYIKTLEPQEDILIQSLTKVRAPRRRGNSRRSRIRKSSSLNFSAFSAEDQSKIDRGRFRIKLR